MLTLKERRKTDCIFNWQLLLQIIRKIRAPMQIPIQNCDKVRMSHILIFKNQCNWKGKGLNLCSDGTTHINWKHTFKKQLKYVVLDTKHIVMVKLRHFCI